MYIPLGKSDKSMSFKLLVSFKYSRIALRIKYSVFWCCFYIYSVFILDWYFIATVWCCFVFVTKIKSALIPAFFQN